MATGTITLAEAAPLLGVSYRQAKRLWRRYGAQGTAALGHGNVGRRSNRAHPEAERTTVLALIERNYGGPVAKGPGQRFGPTLVAEHLWLEHGRLVARSTLRDLDARRRPLAARDERPGRTPDASGARPSGSSSSSTGAFMTGSKGAGSGRATGAA